jgi:hypothetical protein
MHPSDLFATATLASVLELNLDLDTAIRLCNNHSIGARSKFCRLVDEFTRP